VRRRARCRAVAIFPRGWPKAPGDVESSSPSMSTRVDAVRAPHVAVQTGCAGFAADVSDAVVEQVPVEAEAELLAFVGLDLIDRERQL